MTDLATARALGVSRRTVQKRREAAGIPAARKPSPVADGIVEAVRFLDLGEGVALHDILDRLSPPTFPSDGHRRLWRVQMRANVCKLVGGRLVRVSTGIYRLR